MKPKKGDMKINEKYHTIPKVRVKISEYPYKVYKRFRNAVEWINSNIKKINSSDLSICLPKRIYNKLTFEEFNFLEEQIALRLEYLWYYEQGLVLPTHLDMDVI